MKLDIKSVQTLLSMSDDGLMRALSLFGSVLGIKLTREPNAQYIRTLLERVTEKDLERVNELLSSAEETQR